MKKLIVFKELEGMAETNLKSQIGSCKAKHINKIKYSLINIY